MKKVIHLISTSAFSGAENVACQIMNGFKHDSNYEMVYVSEIGLNKRSLEERNINYFKLDKFNYRSIKKAINELKPDIIHAHDPKASVLAALFHKKAQIISHIHSNHSNMRKLNLKTILYNIFSKYFHSIIWVSQSALNQYFFKNSILNKSIVLYNVINSNELYEKIKEDYKEYYNYDLIYIGRLSYTKNPQRLIKIIYKISQLKNDIKVAIVGTGIYENEIKEMIQKYNLQKNIDLFGYVENPYKILSSSKMLIMTSRIEGTPMVALEAIALGKPIICTPTDGLIEIVENEKTGFISNDDEQICNFILKLLKDSNLLTEMEKSILIKNKEINNFSVYIKKMNEIYEAR